MELEQYQDIWIDSKVISTENHDFTGHDDLRVWNIIISGMSVAGIDYVDDRRFKYDLKKSKIDVLKFINGEDVDFEDAIFR